MEYIGYARVSTVGQDLDNQIAALTNAKCNKIFHGKQSGASEQNEQKLKELVEYVRDGDTVVVTKLDRLGRSLKAILETIQSLKDKGATFKTLDGSIDTTNDSPFATAQLSLIGVFAQLERDLIAQRTTEGRIAAQDKGVKFGRKLALTEQQRKDVKTAIESGQSISSLARQYEVSRQTIMRVRAS